MPTYDYVCAANGRTVEVFHGLSVELQTWGELCTTAEIDPGDTPTESPVEKGITAGQVLTRGPARSTRAPRGGGGGGCCSGGCGCGH